MRYSCPLLPPSSQVKVLYIRNLMLTTTESQIEEVFSKLAPVERVKKIRDYAFIHFHSKEDAHTAMEAMNGILVFWQLSRPGSESHLFNV